MLLFNLSIGICGEYNEDHYIQAFVNAAGQGDIQIVNHWLQQGVDQFTFDTAFANAARHNQLDIINILLQGPNLASSDGMTWAIEAAADQGHARVVRMLLNVGNLRLTQRDINDAFTRAVIEEKAEIVRVLVAHVDRNTIDRGYRNATNRGYRDIAQLIHPYTQ